MVKGRFAALLSPIIDHIETPVGRRTSAVNSGVELNEATRLHVDKAVDSLVEEFVDVQSRETIQRGDPIRISQLSHDVSPSSLARGAAVGPSRAPTVARSPSLVSQTACIPQIASYLPHRPRSDDEQ
jgi:hypothetical protein